MSPVDINHGGSTPAEKVVIKPSAPVLVGVTDAALVDREEKIVLAGTVTSDYWLSRWRSTGALDLDFGADGRASADISGSTDNATGVVELDDGRLAIAGSANGQLVVGVYTVTGAPDETVGVDGFLYPDVTMFGVSGLNTLARDAEGRFLALGYVTTPLPVPVVVRLLPDGLLDPSFGDGGVAFLDFDGWPSSSATAFSLVLDADGRPVVSCTIGDIGAGTGRIGVARLWP